MLASTAAILFEISFPLAISLLRAAALAPDSALFLSAWAWIFE